MAGTSLLISYLTDQLELYGIPSQYVYRLTQVFFSSDIVGLAIRLALLSFLVHIVKSRLSSLQLAIKNMLFVTVHTKGGAMDWMRAWLYQDPEIQRQLVQYRMIAEDEATGDAKKKAKQAYRRTGATIVEDGVCFRFAPLSHREISIRHEGRKLWLNKVTGGYANEPGAQDHFRLTAWRWDKKVITDFILMVHKQYHEKNDDEIHIFNHTPKVANWDGPIIRPARPWTSVILPGTVKEDLLNDVKEFVSEDEKESYASRGIPHRRGYLLHGPPGTGKTTMATALASKLRMDLYIVNPAAPGMDNGKLQKCFRNCPKGSLLLIEDIDCVMPAKRRVGGSAADDDTDESIDGEPDEPANAVARTASLNKNDLGPSSVTLSGLLNAIDGVASQEDSVLFASTNYPNKLDEALRRPGRFDVHVAFDYAVQQQAADLYKHFYPVSPTTVGAEIDEKEELDLDGRANEFAETILPQGHNVKLSIAAIQAYLLLHKKDAAQALAKAKEWVEGVEREQSEEVVVVKKQSPKAIHT